MRSLSIAPEYKVDRRGNFYNPKGRPIAKTAFYPREGRPPIIRVAIMVNGKRKHLNAKRLVIETFKPSPKDPKAKCIINLDYNPLNIAANNLSWVREGFAERHNNYCYERYKSKGTNEFSGAF